MLTPQEESTLRKLARDNTPPQVVNPQTGPPPDESEARAISRALERCGPRAAHDLNDDPEVTKRLRAAGLKDLKPGEVYAFGPSRAQILTLAPKELFRLVTQARARAVDEGVGPRTTPTAAPRKRWSERLKTWIEVGNEELNFGYEKADPANA